MTEKSSASSSIESLVGELAGLDVKLRVEEGRLRVSAPRGAVTEALQAKLSARKPELLAFLAAAGGGASGGEAPLVRVSRDAPIPLSQGQQRIFSLAQLRPESVVYNTSTAYHLAGPLDVAALEAALGVLAERHEALRTSFPADHEGPRQRIAPVAPLTLTRADATKELKRLEPAEREPQILRLLQAEVQRRFDLERGPLWRPLLLRVGPDEHILSLTLHHSIFDGGSSTILVRELSAFYRAFAAGEGLELPELTIQYADFAVWERERLRGELGERQLAYWKKKLDGATGELLLPIDKPRTEDGTFRGTSRTFTLPESLARAVTALGRREQASLFPTLLAAFATLLHRTTGQVDLLLCSPFASRDRAELEGLIGYFNNIVVMRADLSKDPTFRELLGRVRRLSLEASDHQKLPLQRVAELPNLVRVPLTRGMFCYQDVSARRLDLPGITATPIDIRKETADFDLALYMQTETNGQLAGILEYNAELFADETIGQLLRDFETVLACVAKEPETRLSQLPRFGPQRADIEARLAADPQIDEALVVELSDAPGTIAYLVLNEYDTPSLDAVRERLRAVLPEYAVPLAFVPLDQLPLLADGKVDREALPLPILVRGRPATEYVAPRTELEAKLAEIWRRVLWLDQDVGIRDRFADLGGHSLLSVQLVVELEAALGRAVPVSVLSRLNTIEDMAHVFEHGEEDEAAQPKGGAPLAIPQKTYHALLAYTTSWVGERVSPESLVVGLNTEGTREPLFWCLQRYGELTQLAKYLGSDQPVFGMRSGNRVMLRTEENIGALAEHYVGEILATKASGPFFLGGNCQAADVAFEIARGLVRRGHEVAQLILLEKFVPKEYAGRVALLFGEKSDRNPYLYYHHPEIGWKKFYAHGHTLDFVPGKHAKFFVEPNVQGMVAAVRRRLAEGVLARAVQKEEQKGVQSEVQKLSRAAYRATLTAAGSLSAAPGEVLRIPVDVVNSSPVAWRRGEVSGIALANRWLDAKGEVAEPRDGRTPLPADLPPGARMQLVLDAHAPRKTGTFTLELDLIDEGICWFGDEGSPRARIEVEVRRRSNVLAGFRTLLQGLGRRA